MRAVLHTGYPQPWVCAFGELPWALLPGRQPPVAGILAGTLRVNLGIAEARLVLRTA